MDGEKIVIIGGVAAGASAAAKARRCSEDAEIIMFEKGPYISYATCGLPYYLSGVIEKRRRLLITQVRLFETRFNVRVKIRHKVLRIDRLAKKIEVEDLAAGRCFEESYDKLILAMGADAMIPSLPGIDHDFVFSLKTLEDTDRIYEFLQKCKPEKAVVVGGGLVGMEVAENLIQLGLQVCLVEFLPQLLSFLDQEMAEFVAMHCRDKGLVLHLGQGLAAISAEGGGKVKTSRGLEIEADMVVVAVGVRPNTCLAEDAGLAIGTTGGIQVDEFMVTSDPDILAAGDCVESLNLVTGRPALIPMGSAANKEGRAAGANALGRRIPVKGFTGTIIVKVFNLTVAKTGLSEKEAATEGYSPFVTYVIADHHAGYYPGAKDICIKVVADHESGRLLGAQIIGEEGVDKRIDVMATAIYNNMAAEDLIHLDLAYAPPYSSARDPVIVSGALNQNYRAGDWTPVTPAELHEKINSNARFTLVDVRTRRELEKEGVIPGALHIPLDELRDRSAELAADAEVILYCAVGLRSYIATRLLLMAGFSTVKALTGGIAAWTYPIVDWKG